VEEWIGTALQVGIPLVLLLAGYFVGGSIERRHYRSIQAREQRWRGLPAVTFRSLPDGWIVDDSALLTGSVVVSVDYFKRFLAGLRALIGGRIKAYEPLLDRARREAQLRMLESAQAQGFNGVVNVRLETARLASSRGNGEGVAGLEVLAFGTGVVREST